jgi:hypothetical protein
VRFLVVAADAGGARGISLTTAAAAAGGCILRKKAKREKREELATEREAG